MPIRPIRLATLRPASGVALVPDWRERAEASLRASTTLHRLGKRDFAVDLGDGSNLQLSFSDGELRFAVLSSELAEDDADDALESCGHAVWSLARPLALALRWELIAEAAGVEYLLSERCPDCQAACFDDETQCSVCGAQLVEPEEETLAAAESNEQRAQRLVTTLLSRGLLKLVAHRHLPAVVSQLSDALERKLRAAELGALLMELDEVDELFADDDELRELLQS